jgi:hypothetical protein
MIFWSLCVFIWFRNMKKMLLQMTSVSVPVPNLYALTYVFLKLNIGNKYGLWSMLQKCPGI